MRYATVMHILLNCTMPVMGGAWVQAYEKSPVKKGLSNVLINSEILRPIVKDKRPLLNQLFP